MRKIYSYNSIDTVFTRSQGHNVAYVVAKFKVTNKSFKFKSQQHKWVCFDKYDKDSNYVWIFHTRAEATFFLSIHNKFYKKAALTFPKKCLWTLFHFSL